MDLSFNYKRSKNCDILFIGNISLDKIQNQQKILRTTIGGSAYISAYCSKTVANDLNIKIFSVIGEDFPLDIINFLKNKKIDVSEVQLLRGKSNSFFIKEKNNKSKIEIKHLLELDSFPRKKKTKHLHISCRKGVNSPYSYLTTLEYERSSMDVIFSSLAERDKEIKKCLELIDILFLNYEEYKILNKSMNSQIEFSFPKVTLIITKGKDGVIIKKGRKTLSFPGLNIDKKKIVSTIGAGDVFLGSFLGAYYSINSPLYALAVATSVAALSVQNFGISHISEKLTELENYLKVLLPKYKKIEHEFSELFFK